MKNNLVGLLLGSAAGFVISWAHLSDPKAITDMLLLREPDIFLLMGSAIVVAAIGLRILRAVGARAVLTGELIAWTLDAPERRHVAGSVLFGLGWSVAGTCPGPVAAMIGQGNVAGVVVAGGIVSGVLLQGWHARARTSRARVVDVHSAVGL